MTNLFELIKDNDLAGVIKAIENGADVDLQDMWGWTALHYALDYGRIEIAKYLIEKGADVNLQEGMAKITALHLAVLKNNLEMVKYLIEKGADVKLQDKYGWTALDHAKSRRNQEMIDLLTTKK